MHRRNRKSAKRVGLTERKAIVAISILLVVVVASIASYYAGLAVGNARLNAVGIYADSSRSVVTIEGDSLNQTVLGSGFVIHYASSDYIVTNFHVVDGMANVTVTFWDGNAYPAKVIGSDGYEDTAILSVPAPPGELHPLQLGSSSSLSVGDPVAAIGNPYGLSGSITVGIVGQLGRTIQSDATAGGYAIADVLQFSAPINPGNSGGPLLNADDFVVGVTTAQVVGSQGLGFAIPSNTIARELPSLVNTGTYAKHPYLGIEATDMNYELSQVTHGTVTYGVLVEKSVGNGPASLAGVKGGTNLITVAGQQYLTGGDIIVSMNGARIVNNDALSTYLERYTLPGQTIQIGIIRGGKLISVQVTLGTRPPL